MSDDIDRTDEYLELTIEDERREAAAGNGWPDHIPLPTEPPDDEPYRNNTHEPGDEDGDDDEPTTWEPIDLGPWMNGEITQPEPSLGITRSDGQRLIYPGREHAVLGETESGKTWLALGCVAAELTAGNHVVYIHYEEGDPGSTLERLQLLDVDPAMITNRLRFVAPSRPARTEWITALLHPAPTLVVHDGVNEAMSLIGADVIAVDGAAMFRRQLVTPFLRAGAATLACDHLPMVRDAGRRDAYGSVHKGNTLDGARIMLENTAPFGRHMRGVSYVFATKDRPGHLRANGRPGKTPGKTFMGTFVVDDSETFGPDFAMRFFAPKDDEDKAADNDPNAGLADIMYDVVAALPDHAVTSERMLFAEMRKAGHQFTNTKVKDALDDLIVAGRLTEVPGKRGANGYQAVVTASAAASEDPPSDCVGDCVVRLRRYRERRSRRRRIRPLRRSLEAVRSSPKQSYLVKAFLQPATERWSTDEDRHHPAARAQHRRPTHGPHPLAHLRPRHWLPADQAIASCPRRPKSARFTVTTQPRGTQK